ERVS
ncbi:HAD hydrolase, IIB family protein, partial [Chlamydia psittaci 06-1683]